MQFNLPSSFLYLKTKLSEDILGGVYVDNFIDIRYKNTGSIKDTNNKEIKTSAYGKAWINQYEHFKDMDKEEVENYARYILWFIGGGVIFWLTIAFSTDKTLMPVLFILLAL